MTTLLNLFFLFCLCAYAQTGNIVLLVLSCIHLSLCTIGCISVMLANFKSPALQWEGWLPFVISCLITIIVVYFTKESSMGLWYFCVTSFWHAMTLASKNVNNNV